MGSTFGKIALHGTFDKIFLRIPKNAYTSNASSEKPL
jgi:hypothetical protein